MEDAMGQRSLSEPNPSHSSTFGNLIDLALFSTCKRSITIYKGANFVSSKFN